MWKFWLILSGIFLIIEIINLGFLVFWFAVGAILAMVVSLLTDNLIIQGTVFIISSTILIFATKPLVNRILPKDSVVKTNALSIEGKTGKVIIDINPTESTGQIKIDGEAWSAKSSDNTYIPKNSEVIVEKIEGVKAVVKKV